MIISVALMLFLLSRKSFELGGQKTKKDSFEDIRNYSKLKSSLVPLIERSVNYFKIIIVKMHKILDGWMKSVREYKRMNQDKNDHVLETSSDFSDKGDTMIDSSESGEVEDLVKEDGKKDTASKATKKTSVAVKKRWSNGLEFRKGVKKKINLRNKITKKIGKTSAHLKSDVSKKLDDFVKKDTESSPMISDSVVYPESKKIEMQRESVKKKQQEKKQQLEEVLVERIAQDPRDVDAYERLGDYYKDQGNNTDARSCYKYVLKLNPLNEQYKTSAS